MAVEVVVAEMAMVLVVLVEGASVAVSVAVEEGASVGRPGR